MRTFLAAFGLALCFASAGAAAESATRSAAATESEPPRRIVSMNPSVSAILVALGASDRLVGVDDFSARALPELEGRPRVGGLYNPSLEAVVALEPDLVVLVPSFEQRAFRRRLAEVGVPMLSLDPVSFEDVLASIETLGERVGRAEAARERVGAIRATRAEVGRRARELPRRRVVLVVQREPLFVIGEGSFVDEMLEVVGAVNLGAELGDPYPRASVEWLVHAAPEVILDAAPDPEGARSFWGRWPSLPAVREDRVVSIPQGRVTLPGPELDRALRDLARAVHGERWTRRAERAR